MQGEDWSGLSKIAINHATNVGWTNIPTGKSVVASRAIMKSSFSFLGRKMFMIMFKVRAI